MPRDISPTLEAHLQGRYATTCYIWSIVPVDDGVSERSPEYYTSHDRDLLIDGNTYKSEGGVAPTAYTTTKDLSSDPFDVTTVLRASGITEERLLTGYYDGARVEIRQVNYAGDLGDSWILTAGTMGKVDVDDATATAEISPWTQRLGQARGRLYGPLCDCPLFARGRCRNGDDVGGPGDGPDMDDPDGGHYATGTIEDVTDAGSLRTSITGKGEDWAVMGRLIFTSGPNAGKKITVDSYDTATGDVTLKESAPYLPAVGDSVILEEGCLRTQEACIAHENLINFQGFVIPGKSLVVTQNGG